MKIEEGNTNKKNRINKQFSISIILALVIFMISGSTAAMSYAAPQTLPSCTDPTGQNLPCMMVISTLPPPPNVLQCQETSGQLLPCSYATQNLSNGEQIVAITVYVPISYVFTGYGPWTIVKQVVHETKTRIVHEPQKPTCERPDANAKTDLDTDLKTKDCDLGDANEHGTTPLPCKDNTTCPIKLPFNCNSPGYNGTCPTENMTKGNMSSIMNPLNMTSNMSSVISKPPGTNLTANTSSEVSTPSGGKSTGTSCTNNCTTGTPPPVDCTKNPNDPSCPQSMTPPPTMPTTKTCPDGSVIDASATCPTPSTNPNTPPPPSSSTPPPPPPSDNGNPSGGSGSSNGGGGSNGNNNNGGGSSSGGGSSPP
jgi:uncharacterized membrane protein YgcG